MSSVYTFWGILQKLFFFLHFLSVWFESTIDMINPSIEIIALIFYFDMEKILSLIFEHFVENRQSEFYKLQFSVRLYTFLKFQNIIWLILDYLPDYLHHSLMKKKNQTHDCTSSCRTEAPRPRLRLLIFRKNGPLKIPPTPRPFLNIWLLSFRVW